MSRLPDSKTLRFTRNVGHSMGPSSLLHPLFHRDNTILNQYVTLSPEILYSFVVFLRLIYSSNGLRNEAPTSLRLRPIVPPTDDVMCVMMGACALSIAIDGAKLPSTALAPLRRVAEALVARHVFY
ncbi:unnamed protein product [Lasius platythorax]|uniref:Uncharacterized protein n=1 Tax=Lasius platythorax TaxID=488582 RepID=A0AAV2P8N1_9HYME